MKLIAGLIAAIGFSAIAGAATTGACPELTGHYVCQSKDSTQDVTLSQKVVNGVTTYTEVAGGNTNDIPAENKDYPIDDKANNVTGTVRVDCNNNALLLITKGEQRDQQNNVTTSWDLTAALSLSATKDLVQVTTGTTTQGGKVSPANETDTCTRQAN